MRALRCVHVLAAPPAAPLAPGTCASAALHPLARRSSKRTALRLTTGDGRPLPDLQACGGDVVGAQEWVLVRAEVAAGVQV